MLLDILSNTDKQFSELISRIPKYNSTPELELQLELGLALELESQGYDWVTTVN